MRLLLSLSLFAVMYGCGGGGPSGITSGVDPQAPPDEETARLWTAWADEAERIASVTNEMYQTGRMFPELMRNQQQSARSLASRIRAEEAGGVAAQLADSMGQLDSALAFAVEYAENTGAQNLGGIFIAGLDDAIGQINEDAAALRQVASLE